MTFLIVTFGTALIIPWVLPGMLLTRWCLGDKTPHDLPLAIIVGLALLAVFGSTARWLGIPASWPFLLVCLASAPVVWKQGGCTPSRVGLLVLGSLTLAFGLPLWGELVTPGGDMSMHTLFAQMIDQNSTFPQTLAPFLPEVRFDVYPIGFHFASVLTSWKLPALTDRVTVTTGLSFVLFGWSLFYLLRSRRREAAAALAAVIMVLASRNPQSYVGWGGAPTVMSVAMVMTGARILWRAWDDEASRGYLLGAVVLAGAVLCHPTAGLFMLPALAIATLLRLAVQGRPPAAWAKLLVAATVGLACILPYLLFQQTEFSPTERQWVLDNMRLPPQSPRPGWSGVLKYVPYTFGDLVLVLSGLMLVVSLYRRRWRALLGLGGLGLVWAVAYLGMWKDFPLAPMIFPERIALFGVPCLGWIVAQGLGVLGIGQRPWRSRRWQDISVTVLTLFLLLGSLSFYQRWYREGIVSGQRVNAADLECMQWIRDNTAADALIAARHVDAGRWVPALTGRMSTSWHLNNAWHDERDEALVGRIPDYVFMGRDGGSAEEYGVSLDGAVSFRRGDAGCGCEIRIIDDP